MRLNGSSTLFALGFFAERFQALPFELVVIPRLQAINPVSTYEVHHAVLLCEATRLCAGC